MGSMQWVLLQFLKEGQHCWFSLKKNYVYLCRLGRNKLYMRNLSKNNSCLPGSQDCIMFEPSRYLRNGKKVFLFFLIMTISHFQARVLTSLLKTAWGKFKTMTKVNKLDQLSSELFQCKYLTLWSSIFHVGPCPSRDIHRNRKKKSSSYINDTVQLAANNLAFSLRPWL